MPQTRFVLKKSLELELQPIVVINKIDKPAADPARCEEQVLELFFELGATDIQAEFSVVYTIGREGIARRRLTDESHNLDPLLDLILEQVPVASLAPADTPLRFQPFNLAYDNFLGRLALGRIYEGSVKTSARVWVKKPNGLARSGQLTKIFTFQGLQRVGVEEATVGDVVLLAGLPDIDIGETVTTNPDTPSLPAIAVDQPTIVLDFFVNDSPFAGREGKYVTSRQLRERLERELEVNVGLRIVFDSADQSHRGATDHFQVSGRGELHIAILLETIRREGYEVQVSQPQVIIREEGGVRQEPFEEVVIDTPSAYQGVIIERLGWRGFVVQDIRPVGEILRLTFVGPTRGLLGYRGQFVIDTKGEGTMSSRVIGFRPFVGEIRRRTVGSMISMAAGKALGYSLWNLQDRGVLYIPPNTEVYEGMVIGNTAKGEEMMVNPTKGKQLTNMRASGSDEAIGLIPPFQLSIERGLETMAEDEYLEITPKSVRLRKQYLTEIDRSRSRR